MNPVPGHDSTGGLLTWRATGEFLVTGQGAGWNGISAGHPLLTSCGQLRQGRLATRTMCDNRGQQRTCCACPWVATLVTMVIVTGQQPEGESVTR